MGSAGRHKECQSTAVHEAVRAVAQLLLELSRERIIIRLAQICGTDLTRVNAPAAPQVTPECRVHGKRNEMNFCILAINRI